MDKIICKWIAKIFILLPYKLQVSIFKKLELGGYIFYRRLAEIAEDEEIVTILKEQATSEYNHAKAFAKECGEPLGWTAGKIMEIPEAVCWGKVRNKFGWGEPTDNISTKYIAARIFFGGESANSYAIDEILVAAAIIEDLQSTFYEAWLAIAPESICPVLERIAIDESAHADTLALVLKQNPLYEALYSKWNFRKRLALCFLPLDLALLLLRIYY